jgi:hypothetical protein
LPSTAFGSSSLAIASITAVLRDLLADALIRHSSVTRLGDVTVSVLPPDRIALGTDEPNQLNLFMFRVTPHSIYRERTGGGANGVSAPRGTLSLDLHYLLTAYGSQDFCSEVLLGFAVHLLSRTPVLTGEIIRAALQPQTVKGEHRSMSPMRDALATWTLEQADEIRATQQFMSFEDSSKLWSMLQARYRPSVTYEVSAVGLAEA